MAAPGGKTLGHHSHRAFVAPCCANTWTMCRHAATNIAQVVVPGCDDDPGQYPDQVPLNSCISRMITWPPGWLP